MHLEDNIHLDHGCRIPFAISVGFCRAVHGRFKLVQVPHPRSTEGVSGERGTVGH
jgi:hypothetical protein